MRDLSLGSSALFLLLGLTPACADRPITQEERIKLESQMADQGCTGGNMEFNDGGYEIDEARCSDDKIYDLKFYAGFNLIEKNFER